MSEESPTFDEQMVEKLQALLLKNAGVQNVTVDGVVVSFSDLEKRLQFYEARVARTNKTKPIVSRINLGNY